MRLRPLPRRPLRRRRGPGLERPDWSTLVRHLRSCVAREPLSKPVPLQERDRRTRRRVERHHRGVTKALDLLAAQAV